MIPLCNIGLGGKNLPLDETENKGVVYWIGTQCGTASFTNPHTAGYVTASWVGNGSGVPADTVDRYEAGANVYTANIANSWWKIDLGTNNPSRRLAATHMRCKNRSTYNDQVPTNGSIHGSNDDATWTLLGGFTTGFWNGNVNVWNTISLNQSLGAFRYFRYRFDTANSNAAWYICIQEYELFGFFTGG